MVNTLKKLEYYTFFKPYDVLSQFTQDVPGQKTLSDFDLPIAKDVYPVGRLDRDSEGLLLLSNDKTLQSKLAAPIAKVWKSYWVQVDGAINHGAIHKLKQGVTIRTKKKEYYTLPAKVEIMERPEGLFDRNPPVRFRKTIPTSWIKISIQEGKNRQIRKMCSAVGFPVLRLIRVSLAKLKVETFKPAHLSKVDYENIF